MTTDFSAAFGSLRWFLELGTAVVAFFFLAMTVAAWILLWGKKRTLRVNEEIVEPSIYERAVVSRAVGHWQYYKASGF